MRFSNSEEVTDYINLFVSVLICFPEVGTIKYDRDREILHLTFILRDMKPGDVVDKALCDIDQALASYHQLEHIEPRHFQVHTYSYENYLVLEVQRDIRTTTKAEISFLIELFRIKFLDYLMMEDIDQNMLDEYDWYEQDETEILTERKLPTNDGKAENKILVLREAGKVLVFSN